MNVNIVKVESRKQMKQFVAFPLHLYKNCENWVPALEGDEYDAVAEVMESRMGDGAFARTTAALRLAGILKELKEASREEVGRDFAWMRKAFYRTILGFARGWMERGEVPRHLAFRNIEAVEAAARQSEKSIGDEAVLSLMLDRMTFP